MKNRNFIIWSGSQFISILGNNFYAIALPWYIYSLTHSKESLAIIGFVLMLPNVASLVSGAFVDRWPKRMVMLFLDAVRAIIVGLMFVAVELPIDVWVLIGLVFLLELAGTAYYPVSSALLPLIVSDEVLPSAMGFSQSLTSSAQLMGMASGGELITLLGTPILFLGDAISFALSTLSMLWLQVTERIVLNKSTVWREIYEGFSYLRKSQMFLYILAIGTFINFLLAPLEISFTLYVKDVLHKTSTWLGLINGALVAGMILGGLLSGSVQKKMSLKMILVITLLLSGTFIFAGGTWISGSVMIVSIGLYGVVLGIANASLNTTYVRLTPERLRGRIFGLISTVMLISAPLGMIAFGFAIQQVRITFVYQVMGGLIWVAGGSFLVPIPDDTAVLSHD